MQVLPCQVRVTLHNLGDLPCSARSIELHIRAARSVFPHGWEGANRIHPLKLRDSHLRDVAPCPEIASGWASIDFKTHELLTLVAVNSMLQGRVQ